MTYTKKTKDLMLSARELAEIVEDFEEYMSELTDVLTSVKETKNVSYLEKFIDKWESRTVSSNDVVFGGALINDVD